MTTKRKARVFRVVREGYVSREVAASIADMKRRLRGSDIRALAVVFVMPGGEVGTAFAGHKDGHFHTLSSGISLLRQRFDDAARE